jgi:hypothetical protein
MMTGVRPGSPASERRGPRYACQQSQFQDLYGIFGVGNDDRGTFSMSDGYATVELHERLREDAEADKEH